jgi:hypothetical protein
MLPDRLQARIRAQLELPAPDLEARVLAAELVALATRARERLEQCAALIRIGNEQAALEAAEAEPRALDLCAWVSFAEADDWRRLCRENGLPLAPPPDDAQILAVELLYGKPIDESHPLYRDYRQAIRERDEARALAVLRTIVAANPGDANARAELARLGAKFARENAGRARDLFAEGRPEQADELMDRMERLGVANLAGDPEWDEALRLRKDWVEANARVRLESLAEQAAGAMAAGRWEDCASAVGAVRTLERNTGLRLPSPLAEDLLRAETWATERVETSRAEASAAAAAESLLEELDRLRAEATERAGAGALRRLRAWLDEARRLPGRIPEARLAEGEALRRDLHARVVRRHTLLTAGWLAALALLLAAANLGLDEFKARSGQRARLAEATRQAETWDLAGARRTLAGLAEAKLGAEEAGRRDAALALLARREDSERQLAAEAELLKAAAQEGVGAGNFADLRRRALALRQALAEGGPGLEARIAPKAGDLPALIARCETVARSLAPEVRSLVASLETAMGTGSALAEPDEVRGLIGRIRSLLDIPETRSAIEADLVDRALARSDLAEERLRLEQRARDEARRLAEASDLKAYLAVLRDMAGATPPSPESRAAAAVLAGDAELAKLPQAALGPRVRAMWEALGEPADPETWSPGELAALAKLTDDRQIRGVRRFIVREHSAQGVRSTSAVYALGEVGKELRRFQAGTETVFTAQVLRRSGDVTSESWSLRRFSNGAVSGEELTEGLPPPELEYQRRFLRSFDPVTRRPGEPLLRTLARVRGESGASLLRAYHLQELLAIAGIRPVASGLAFSPSAQSDARELRRLTQGGLALADFLYPDKWADVRAELDRLLARPAVAYDEEARFLRALLAAAREGGLLFAGRVGPDGGANLRERVPGAILLGLDSSGQAAALFETGSDGNPRRLRDALPFSPLLRLAAPPGESARRAGATPAGLNPPAGGWDDLLRGQDL